MSATMATISLDSRLSPVKNRSSAMASACFCAASPAAPTMSAELRSVSGRLRRFFVRTARA